MRRKIPSTAALTAFEAAARHRSFTKAALELAVTQSAVCRQIAALEDYLSVKLFQRGKRGVALTEAGASYSRSVAVRLEQVERDTWDLMGHGGRGGSIELGVVPTFAACWLVPRLAHFHAEHPDITVHLSSRTRPFLFEDSGLDAAIHATDGGWPGTVAHHLMPEPLVVVGAPSLLGKGPVRKTRLATLPRLQMSTRPYAWRQWFASLGMAVERDLAGPRMELFSMAVAAARHGLGLALVPELLVEDELASGVLRKAIEHPYAGDRAYYFICPEEAAERPALLCFRDWLLQQAQRPR